MRLSPEPAFPSLRLRSLSKLFASGARRHRSAGVKAVAFSLPALVMMVANAASGQVARPDLETPFRAGQAALKRGDFARATEDFKKVLALDPSLVEAQVNLGLAYQSLLDYGAAARYLSEGLRTRPNLPNVNVIVGMDYIKLGSPEKAAPYLKRALALDASSADAHDAMALYCLTQENFQGAAEQYRKVAELDPDKPEALFKIGHQYLDLAARLAYRGARLYPDSSWGHRFLGDMLFQRARWDDAGREYEKGLVIEPRQSGLHTLRGEAYLHTGKVDEAEAEFRRELQMDARYERAWLDLANVELSKGQADAARDSVDAVWKDSSEFLKAHPEFLEVELSKEIAQAEISKVGDEAEGPAKHFLLAALYASTNDTALSDREWQLFQSDVSKRQQAARGASATGDACQLHQYSRCIATLERAKPQTSAGSLLLGKTYFALQQYDRAAEALAAVHGDKAANSEASYWLERTFQALGAESYAQLEASFPESWRTHQLRAEDYALRLDRDNAIKEYETALRLRPNEAELHESLGEFYLDNQSPADAQVELEKAVSLDHSRTKALYLLGRLYLSNNENEQALPFLERALQLQPNLNEANSLLGTALIRMGKFADAIPKLQKAAPLDHMGNIHFQLYQAYRKVGQADLAQKALTRSQELRKSSLEHDQALVMGAAQTDSDAQ